MSDREKVIKGLVSCNSASCQKCPYNEKKECNDRGFFYSQAIEDAIQMLKEREPKPPHYTRLEYLVSGNVVEIYHPECPRCFGNGLFLWDAEIEKGQAYCKRCGQAVKWE